MFVHVHSEMSIQFTQQLFLVSETIRMFIVTEYLCRAKDDVSWLLVIGVFPVDLWDLPLSEFWQDFKWGGIIELPILKRLRPSIHICVCMVNDSHNLDTLFCKRRCDVVVRAWASNHKVSSSGSSLIMWFPRRRVFILLWTWSVYKHL